MARNLRQKIFQFTAFLICIILLWKYGPGVEGTEFSGGRITGLLLHSNELGALLFIVALLLTLFYRRVAAVIGIVAALLSLPLYFYELAPGPFRWLSRGQYSVPLSASFVWTKWNIAGVLALALALCISLCSFVGARSRSTS